MKISLNGEMIKSECRTLMDVIQEQGIEINALIAEVNFQVIKQENWKEFAIKDGDKIELLSFVGGG